MSATRLLVLGALRFMQPAHGYDVRRELVSWQLEESTNVGPGSIYSALRTLEKDGAIRALGSERAAGRPARTAYELTPDGEKEFQTLLRQSWWQVTAATEPLVPALTMMLALPREELVAALQSRITQLQAAVEQATFVRATIRDGATGADGDIPEHVREVIDFLVARAKGKLTWSRQFLGRLQQGAYVFQDEKS